ncbi:MAG: hypothetical protein EAZ89_16045 [Bacteroidetes bacterium]|nr:MAG: hypothetical protein EAZ89_16045 [Bacteroidota bacterium]
MFPNVLKAQYVGFGEASPNSKIDATHSGTTGSTVEATQSNASNTAPAIQVKNSSGGEGMEIQMNATTSTQEGLLITHLGRGSALSATVSNAAITGTIAVGKFEFTGSDTDDHIGVHGLSTSVSGYGIGVQGNGNYRGMYGVSTSGTGVYGSGVTGLYGTGTTYGVYGNGTTYGVYANGNLGASGTKSFLIDHPLDPGNQYLKHFSVESDEVLNLYRGMAVLDSQGRATVQLPVYFEAINTEITYQLTPVGSPQQPWVVTEVSGNSFVVGGAPGSKVSWAIMARRNDAYMKAHPVQAESRKEPENQGRYIRPELYGQPASMGIFTQARQETKPSETPHSEK